jgi:hypothetical protein
MTADQYSGFSDVSGHSIMASGSNDAISITNASSTTIYATDSIETYNFIAGSGSNTINVNASKTGVNITGAWGGAITVDISQATSVSGDYLLSGSGDSIYADNSSGSGSFVLDISGVNSGAATTAETLVLETYSGGSIEISMTSAQYSGFGTSINAYGSYDAITFTDAGLATNLLADGSIETYNLANGVNDFTFAAAMDMGSTGQTVNANGGTLTIEITQRTDDGSGVSGAYVPFAIQDLALSGATDITLDLSTLTAYQDISVSGDGSFANMFGDIDLSDVDHLKIADDLAHGVDWGTLGGGGPSSVDIVARGGANYSLYGTTGNDTIEGGSGTSTLDISQGGNDTVIFSGGVSGAGVVDGLEITGFHATNIGSGGADLLDFTALGLVSKGSMPSSIHFGKIGVSGAITTEFGNPVTDPNYTTHVNDVNVLGFTNLSQPDTATMGQIATAIDGWTFGKFEVGEKMVFLVADSSAASGGGVDTVMYLWDDSLPAVGDETPDDGRVNAAELTKIGVLHDFYQLNIGSLTDSNFVDHSGVPI